MENASKALQIAAGMLIAILILGLIVFVYGKVSNLKKTEDIVNSEKTVADFNKQFEIYNKSGLYGTELLSLANKIVDYNEKYKESDGYLPITINITAVPVKYNGVGFGSAYSSATSLVNAYENVSSLIISKGKESLSGSSKTKTLSQWDKSSEKELKEEGILNNANFNAYKELKKLQTEFARKKFKCTKVEYDTNNRIKKMVFKDMEL